MIIRRLAQALRAQDWFTVAIEFLIVVVGIFVGLQVTNWNETRVERNRERASLEQLLAEAENATAYVERDMEYAADRIAAQRVLLEFMSSDEAAPADLAAATTGFATLDYFPAMVPVRTTYDELTAAGGLQLIRSRRVRDMISLYYADLDFFQGQLEYFRDVATSAGNNPYAESRDYVRAEYDPSVDVGRRYVIDWAGLRSEPYLGTLFVGKLRSQIVTNGNRQRVLERARIMCDTIAAAIGDTCTPTLSAEAN